MKIQNKSQRDSTGTTRAVSSGKLSEFGKTEILQSSYLSDASRAWNKAPENITGCKSIWKAKKERKRLSSNYQINVTERSRNW